jgi:hypothetical protein
MMLELHTQKILREVNGWCREEGCEKAARREGWSRIIKVTRSKGIYRTSG